MKVLLGIPHALLREGLRDVLKRWSEVEIVGISPSALEAARIAERAAPDVLIVARSSKPAEDARAIATMRDAVPASRVVLIEDVGHSGREDALDIDWRVRPTVGPTGLLKGLWTLCAGKAADRAVDSPKAGIEGLRRAPRPLITGREYEVLRAICEGLSNKAIARRLGISEKTVKNHLSSIYRRTKVSGRTQLVLWAMRRGLGTSGSPPET
jgi:DNA-binding NarL/FixJ family response regulator